MVIVSLPSRVVGPLPGLYLWLINGGDPNHLRDLTSTGSPSSKRGAFLACMFTDG